MPDPNITDHIRLRELRAAYDAAKRARNEAAMAQDGAGKLRWMNEVYRISAEIRAEERKLGMRRI